MSFVTDVRRDNIERARVNAREELGQLAEQLSIARSRMLKAQNEVWDLENDCERVRKELAALEAA